MRWREVTRANLRIKAGRFRPLKATRHARGGRDEGGLAGRVRLSMARPERGSLTSARGDRAKQGDVTVTTVAESMKQWWQLLALVAETAPHQPHDGRHGNAQARARLAAKAELHDATGQAAAVLAWPARDKKSSRHSGPATTRHATRLRPAQPNARATAAEIGPRRNHGHNRPGNSSTHDDHAHGA
jgi:hypothetical protein